MISIEWGSVGEWVGGLGGLLAVVAVVVVARLEHNARIEEAARRKRDDEHRSFVQATQVAAYMTAREEQADGSVRFAWELRNSSDSLIFDVKTKVSVSQDITTWDDPLGPRRHRAIAYIHRRPAGETEIPVIGLEIEFKDIMDQYWCRDLHGKLSKGRRFLLGSDMSLQELNRVFRSIDE